MSESFFLAIAGIGSALITGVLVATCRGCLRFKCPKMQICGMTFERNIEQEIEAQQLEFNNPNSNQTDIVPPSRRHSVF